jgi:hypothetical protein
LLAVLASLDAIFRAQPERRLRLCASHLSGSGHLNLLTTNGPLDLLATIGQNLLYEDLLSHSSLMEIGQGIQIQVLDLETLIEHLFHANLICWRLCLAALSGIKPVSSKKRQRATDEERAVLIDAMSGTTQDVMATSERTIGSEGCPYTCISAAALIQCPN